MRKKIMFGLMALETAVKFLALAYLFSTEPGRLPAAIYASACVVTLFGIGLICKKIIGLVGTRLLTGYYMVYGVSVLFNLVFMRLFSRLELTALDFVVIGTFLDVALCAVLVVLSVRENRYVRFTVDTER